MADIKISALTAATTPADADVVPIVQSGTTKKVSVTTLKNVFQPLDADLTAISALTATTNNMIQSVGSAWASRTPTQVKAALAIAESDVTSLVSDLALKAPLASPTFTGTVTVPTPTNTTDATTKAYVDANVGGGFAETTVVYVDDGHGVVGDGSDDSAAIQALLDLAPSIASGTGLRLIFGANDYGLATGLTMHADKNIEIRGVYGKTTPDGTAIGTRLVALTPSMTMLTLNTDAATNIWQNGPHLYDLNFHSGGNAGVTGILWDNINHGRLERISAYQLKYGIIFRRRAGAGGDCAWNDLIGISFYQMGVLDTTGGAAALWFDGGSTTRVFGGEILFKYPTSSGRNYGVLISPSTYGAGSNGNKFYGLKIESDNSALDRTTGFATVVNGASTSVYNEMFGCFFENVGTGVQFGGDFPTHSAGKSCFMHGGHIANALYGIIFDTGFCAGGFDGVGMETVTNPLTDNALGANQAGRIWQPGSSVATGSGGSDRHNTQTGTSYTTVFTDRNRAVLVNNAANGTLTLAANSSVPYPLGSTIDVIQYGAGSVTVTSSDTVRGVTVIPGQYKRTQYLKVNTTEWIGF